MGARPISGWIERLNANFLKVRYEPPEATLKDHRKTVRHLAPMHGVVDIFREPVGMQKPFGKTPGLDTHPAMGIQ
jgi:hypothetical protein